MSPSLQTMGFFMSEINFCNTKEQLNHLGEVVTGKVDGSPSGADIDTSILPYTGQVRKTLPALESEYEQSITDKEAEADAAIDEYRLTNKGTYTSGIELESKFEYITYNGESYFATNPPYTTTATTPDADGNLFIGGYIGRPVLNDVSSSNSASITDSEHYPQDIKESAVNGQSIPIGVSSIVVAGGQYLLSEEIDGTDSVKIIDNIALTPPYSCTLDGVKNYLLKMPYFQKGRSINDIRALGAAGDFDDTAKVGTDNKEVFRAISRDLGGEWTGFGKFYTSITTNYKKRTAWKAPSSMGAGVVFDFTIITADGVPGHIYHYLTTDAGDSGVPFITSATTAADGSVIGDGVTLRNATNTRKPTPISTAHGVWAKVRMHIGKCNISNWEGHNLKVVAKETSTDPYIKGNANSMMLDNPILWGGGLDGLYMEGADANAGKGSAVSAYFNRGHGITDSSFLGNYWPAVNIGLNDTGGIQFTNVNNRSIVMNPYFELGSAGSEISGTGRQGVIGGNVDDTSLSGVPFLYADSGEWRANTTFASYESVNGNNYRSRLGGAASDSLAFQVWESATVDASKWRMQWDSVSKSDFQLRYANIVSATPYKVTGENTTQSFARSSPQPYKMWFENELMVGSASRGAAIKKSAGAPPTSGLAARGDTVFNNNPTATGQPSGWNCITGGTNGIDAVYGISGLIS